MKSNSTSTPKNENEINFNDMFKSNIKLDIEFKDNFEVNIRLKIILKIGPYSFQLYGKSC